MSGNFSLGLLEILVYLFPGGIALVAIVFRYFPNISTDFSKNLWYQFAFIVCSYILGHLITVVSVAILKIRMYQRRISKSKWREEKISYYLELKAKLQELFGSKITRSDEYLFSLRLVTDNLTKSIQEIDRLYALTLFSRNLVVSFLFAAIIFLGTDKIFIVLVSLLLSIIFYIRYFQLEDATGSTVFRSAYTYLCLKSKSKTQDNLVK